MKDWYEAALDELKVRLGQDSRVSGLDFLEDFVYKFRDIYFEELEYSEVDQFVSGEFEQFQDWLKVQSDIKVLSNGKWVPYNEYSDNLQPETVCEASIEAEISFTEDEIKLLDLALYEISGAHYEGFKALYAKLAATNLHEKKYNCAYRFSRCGEINREVFDTELILLWVSASNAASEAGFFKEAGECLSEAAYHSLRISKYREAADYFEQASNTLPPEDFTQKIQLLKNARTQYQMIGDHDSAADVFSKEKKLESNHASKSKKLVLFLYRITSSYGESPKRVAINIVVVLLLATFISYLNGVGAGSPFYGRVIDSLYFSVVTFTTLGYGDILPVSFAGKLQAGLLAILGLLYTSLFMVAVVRKYGRS